MFCAGEGEDILPKLGIIHQGLLGKLIPYPLSLLVTGDQARLSQYCQVSGGLDLTDRQRLHDLAYTELLMYEQVNNSQPGGISQGLKYYSCLFQKFPS
jgi:hypothetical protein